MTILTLQCCHASFISCLKEVREIKFMYLLEGIMFIGSALFALPRWGLTGMLACSLICSCLITWGNGTWRMAKLLQKNQQASLLSLHVPLAKALLVTIPCCLGLLIATRGMPIFFQLVIVCGISAGVGVVAAFRFALPEPLSAELLGKFPVPLRRFSSLLGR
jgi:hypothetical protein